MQHQLGSLRRRVDAVAEQVKEHAGRRCSVCYGTGRLVRFFDVMRSGDSLPDTTEDDPAVCKCGRPLVVTRVVFVGL